MTSSSAGRCHILKKLNTWKHALPPFLGKFHMLLCITLSTLLHLHMSAAVTTQKAARTCDTCSLSPHTSSPQVCWQVTRRSDRAGWASPLFLFLLCLTRRAPRGGQRTAPGVRERGWGRWEEGRGSLCPALPHSEPPPCAGAGALTPSPSSPAPAAVPRGRRDSPQLTYRYTQTNWNGSVTCFCSLPYLWSQIDTEPRASSHEIMS